MVISLVKWLRLYRQEFAGFLQNFKQLPTLISSPIQNQAGIRVSRNPLNQTRIQKLPQITVKTPKIQVTTIHKPSLIRPIQSLTQNLGNNLHTTPPTPHPSSMPNHSKHKLRIQIRTVIIIYKAANKTNPKFSSLFCFCGISQLLFLVLNLSPFSSCILFRFL